MIVSSAFSVFLLHTVLSEFRESGKGRGRGYRLLSGHQRTDDPLPAIQIQEMGTHRPGWAPVEAAASVTFSQESPTVLPTPELEP